MKIHRVMKLCIIIVLAGCLQVAANGFGQTITLSNQNNIIEKVFGDIQKQTDVGEFMRVQNSYVTIYIRNAGLDDVLELWLKRLPVEYFVVDLSVRRVGVESEPLVGAIVNVKGTNYSTITSNKGELVINSVNKKSVLDCNSYGKYKMNSIIGVRYRLVKVRNRKKCKLDETNVVEYGTTNKKLESALNKYQSLIKGSIVTANFRIYLRAKASHFLIFRLP